MRRDGASSSRSLPAWRRAVVASLAGLLVALAVSSCGTSASEPASSLATNNLLQGSDFSRYPQGSVEGTFFKYWSSLQFRSWAEAAAYYDPSFRDFMGTATLIGAKKLNGSTYPLLKPTVARVGSQGDETTVYYTLRLADGSKELNSMTWRKEGGNWQVIYDSRLDAELAQLAQNRVEIDKSGSLPTDASQAPSPQAAKAGLDASQFQARFREQELETGQP